MNRNIAQRRLVSDSRSAIEAYLENLPLIDALWWFIENGEYETHRQAIFLRLRERVREQHRHLASAGIEAITREYQATKPAARNHR
ncbi:MAG: hypothetical protein ACYC9L_06710 [Sulfuricaulis sp.]